MVDQVKCRVRQRLFCQITLSQTNGIGHDRFGNGEMMEVFVCRKGSFQDTEAKVSIGFFEADLFQFGDELFVRLDIFGVAIDGGGAEQKEITFTQLLFQHGGCSIEAALFVKQFVNTFDDQNGIFGLADLGQYLFEAVFDFALVGGIGTEGCQIQLIQFGIVEE